jgi:predicted ATPase
VFIKNIVIKNFRAVSNLNIDTSPHMNVVVGPNGVGKTTILQAIRLAKAIAAPRTQSEAFQVLISLGAASPHFGNRVFLEGLARDSSRQVEIRCAYSLTTEEIDVLRMSTPEITQNLVLGQIGQNFANPASLFQFLQSPEGQAALAQARPEVDKAVYRLNDDPTLVLGLTVDPVSRQMSSNDPLAGPIIAFLDQRLPPSHSIFSYFPADRALPMGEVGMQLGGPDAQQQIEMHNSQPQIKYQRLKTLIINALMFQGNDSVSVKEEFETIFTKLLRGRKISEIKINELGLLSVLTEEVKSGRIIELDSLSSGEKNIALTFLIVSKSIARGGIALFDEPELHLNPAVSRDLLPFVMEYYSKPRSIQFFMCTHSPEILSGAFSNEDCALLHLKSDNDLTRVGKRALDEYSDALVRLGTSVSETLLYEGTLLVEGDDDVNFMLEAFPDVLRKYNVKDLGGRREIEKNIGKLQDLEARNQKLSPIFLIFDRDESITDLKSSKLVKVMQWKRRTLENYMIGTDVWSELLRGDTVTRSPIASGGEVHKLMLETAFSQINSIAAREVYNTFGYQNATATRGDLIGSDIDQIADILFARVSAASKSLAGISNENWKSEFLGRVAQKVNEITLQWEAKWIDLCDAKRLISDMHKRIDAKVSEATLRTMITRKMRDTESEDWRVVRSLLSDLLRPSAHEQQ